jgi:hypothetical protein
MAQIINFKLRDYNKKTSEMFRDDSNERNAELFFAVGVSVESKDIHLFYNHIGGIDRILETMEVLTRELRAKVNKSKS